MPSVNYTNILAADSVCGTAPQIVDFRQKINARRAFYSRLSHSRFYFFGTQECSRLFQTLPFEEQSDVIYISGAVEDPATSLVIFVPQINGGIERHFPRGIVGDFVVDQNIDHGEVIAPFFLIPCSQKR